MIFLFDMWWVVNRSAGGPCALFAFDREPGWLALRVWAERSLVKNATMPYQATHVLKSPKAHCYYVVIHYYPAAQMYIRMYMVVNSPISRFETRLIRVSGNRG